MSSQSGNWVKCPEPEIGDVIRWVEPIWAAPSKARGKPAKMGEQMVTAEVVLKDEIFELYVMHVEKHSGGGSIKVKIGDSITRKLSSIALGNCQKQTS
jgi:hypothetical protein